MKCKVGDKVRFLNDVGGGKVTRIDKNTVYVLSNDGFETPVMLSEVIVVNPASEPKYSGSRSYTQDDSTIKGKETIEPEQESEPEIEDLANILFLEDDDKDETGEMVGLHLAFVAVDQQKTTESDQQLYLVNDSPYRVFYALSKWNESTVSPINAGFLYPDSKELVKSYKRESLNTDITFNIQCIFFKNIDFTPQQPEFYDLRINPTKFFRAGSFADNDFFNEKAIIYSLVDSKKEQLLNTLTDKNIEEVIKQKDTVAKPIVKLQEPEVEEIDLHIHELVENSSKLSAGEIIEIQLARFKVALEGGLKSKARKMVFIHGVGNGKLKHEIRKELDNKYSNLKYQDASFKEYGYGATMVFLRNVKR
ncbi:MAG: DUF2027 domain-containing protein [Tenuifilaceae bacterium]|nr:DUF2027 domain-containing protein [Tenuifilaceae bacterium]